MWGSSILVKLTIGLYIFVDEPVTDEHFELILGRFINTITIIFDEANAVQIGKKLFTFQSNLAHGLTVTLDGSLSRPVLDYIVKLNRMMIRILELFGGPFLRFSLSVVPRNSFTRLEV